MSDIVERLRIQKMDNPYASEYGKPAQITVPLCAEAADTITALRAEVERLREALGHLDGRPWRFPMRWLVLVGYDLERMGLAKRTWFTDKSYLTPLGLAVRAILKVKTPLWSNGALGCPLSSGPVLRSRTSEGNRWRGRSWSKPGPPGWE